MFKVLANTWLKKRNKTDTRHDKSSKLHIDLYNIYICVYRFAGYSSKESIRQLEPSPGLISRRPQEIPKTPRHNTNCL